jgi:hypothetical protein
MVYICFSVSTHFSGSGGWLMAFMVCVYNFMQVFEIVNFDHISAFKVCLKPCSRLDIVAMFKSNPEKMSLHIFLGQLSAFVSTVGTPEIHCSGLFS